MAFIFAQNNSIAPVEMAKVELELAASETNQIRKKEKWQHILREILIPFIIAGIGMVAAGILFDIVETWDLFQFVTALITLIPALLDLKGNIEMTLASRLSTQMHVKKIYDSKTKLRAALGNIAIIQLQAIVIGFLASFVTCLLDYILHQQFVPKYLLILIGSSVATASFSAFIIGGIIIVIILVSSKFNINPDNIATPIASSLGDLVSLSILAGFGTFLFVYRDNIWIHITILSLFLLSIPFLAYYCYTNEFVKEVLFYGWVPNLVSMLISCFAGVILETGLKIYPGIKIYQPIVNGLGGNLVAIYASRMSTQMHLDSEMGKWCLWAPKRFYLYPKETFISEKNPEDVVARILVLLALPSHLVFFFIIYFIDITLVDSSVKYLDASLVILYLIVAVTQVILLITICFAMSHIAWRLNRNPDNVCIPVMTSLGDFLGCAFLFLCFHLSYVLGNEKVFIDAYQQTASISTTIFSTIFEFYNH